MQDLMPPVNTPGNIFDDGDPSTGLPGTIVPSQWLNDVQFSVRDIQQECKNILAKAGITPDPRKQSQLADAITAIVAKGWLEKSRNGADIPNKSEFVKNLGLPELIAGNPPAALNTLEKLAQAINNDANFSNSLSEIIKNRQPLNATLTALAGLVTGGDLLPYFTGADTATLSPITPTGRDLISRGSINAVLAYLRFEHGQGWYRLGDIYIQFGLIDFSSSTRVFVEFPFKFPTTVDHVIVSDAGWATGHTWGATNKQRNGFVAHVNVQGEGGQYLAIGR
ncbi:gp53-like domain-containing protein [Xenorhabdus ehlersii]|uniref:Putative tail fiber protein gp53-like C-terminal domain-containing protein n=1 Tax=Xenorhabdus ehlersii TaxID=290111 RepID=A0ABX9PHV8_9GAMM|nr:hypothetical protein [Xenorhabdus ehlersii]RKE91398.1 hypothetical protein BDE27_1620 [Xenorhabdus ehlersii]